MIADPGHLVAALFCAGVGLIFFWNDRGNDASRALSLCLIAIAPQVALIVPPQLGPAAILGAIGNQICEAISLLAGVEWGRRVGRTATATQRLGKVANGVFRAAQILLLVYAGLSIGYVLIAPEAAILEREGLIRVSALEFAIFAPVLGTAVLLTGIAIGLLLLLRIDPAEAVRLRALFLAGPLFLFSLILSERWETLALACGLVVFLAGAVRYLMIQSQRGQFMAQFLSPELARLVREKGVDQALSRERRMISALACDLRGFTAFAREADSDAVVSLLERYYAKVGEMAATYGGTIKDHAGDGLLILLGAPVPNPDHARQAMRLALTIQAARPELLGEQGRALGLGIGIATGRATVGAIQGAGRLEYVAVGNVVNLAARLCDRAADGEILVDARTRSAADGQFAGEEKPPEALKGYPDPVPVFAIAAPSGNSTQKQEPSPGVDSTEMLPP